MSPDSKTKDWATRRAAVTHWLPRISLYQTAILFSLVVVGLALRSVETTWQKLMVTKAAQIELNRPLVIDDPTRMVGILTHPRLAETRWDVYIPSGTVGSLIMDGRKVASLNAGSHIIVVDSDREKFGSFRYNFFVDDVMCVEKRLWNPGQVALRTTTSAAVDEKLVLSFQPHSSTEPLMWIEAERE